MQRTLRVFLSMLAVALLYGCSSSLEDMVVAGAEGHTISTTQSVADEYSVDNVAGENMLRDSYAVFYRTTFCLTAPTGAQSYEWIVEVGENANGDTPGIKYLLGTEQNLVVYIPENSSLKRWAEYKLTLTVTKTTGVSYSDTANLYIY